MPSGGQPGVVGAVAGAERVPVVQRYVSSKRSAARVKKGFSRPATISFTPVGGHLSLTPMMTEFHSLTHSLRSSAKSAIGFLALSLYTRK